MYRVSHLKFLESLVLWEKTSIFSPLGFDLYLNFCHKIKKPSSTQSALKCYLNEKNLMHGRVMVTISKFSPQIFETYLANCPNGVSYQIPYIILGVYEKFSREFHQ